MNQSIVEMQSSKSIQSAGCPADGHEKVLLWTNYVGTNTLRGGRGSTKMNRESKQLYTAVESLIRLLVEDEAATVTYDTVQHAIYKYNTLKKVNNFNELKEIDDKVAKVSRTIHEEPHISSNSLMDTVRQQHVVNDGSNASSSLDGRRSFDNEYELEFSEEERILLTERITSLSTTFDSRLDETDEKLLHANAEMVVLRRRLIASKVHLFDDVQHINELATFFNSELAKAKAELAQAETELALVKMELAQVKADLHLAEINQLAFRKENGDSNDKLVDFAKALDILRVTLRNSESYISTLEGNDATHGLQKSQAEVEDLKLQVAALDAEKQKYSMVFQCRQSQYVTEINELREQLSLSKSKATSLMEELSILRFLPDKVDQLEVKYNEAKAIIDAAGPLSASPYGRDDSEALRQAHDELTDLKHRMSALTAARSEDDDFLRSELDDTKLQLSLAETTIMALHDELKLLSVKLESVENNVEKARASRRKAEEEVLSLEGKSVYAMHNFASAGMQDSAATNCKVAELELQLCEAQANLQRAKEDAKVMEKGYLEFLEDAVESLKQSDADAKASKKALEKAQRSQPSRTKSKLNDHSTITHQMVDAMHQTLEAAHINVTAKESSILEAMEARHVKAEGDQDIHSTKLDYSRNKVADIYQSLRKLESDCDVQDVSEIPSKLSCLGKQLVDMKKKYTEARIEIHELQSALALMNNCSEASVSKKAIYDVSQKPLPTSDALQDLAFEERLVNVRQQLMNSQRSAAALEEKLRITESLHAESEQEIVDITTMCNVSEIREVPAKIFDMEKRVADLQREVMNTHHSSASLEENLILVEPLSVESERECDNIAPVCGVRGVIEIRELPTEISALKKRLADLQHELIIAHRTASFSKEKLRQTEGALTRVDAEASALKQILTRLGLTMEKADFRDELVNDRMENGIVIKDKIAFNDLPDYHVHSVRLLQMRLEQLNTKIEKLEREQVDILSQLDHSQSMLFELEEERNFMEEERNYNYAQLTQLTKLLSRPDETELEIRLRDMSIQFAETTGERDTLKQWLQRSEATAKMLCNEIEQKNDLVRELSSRCGFSSGDFMETLRNEQERALTRATELSIELAESQMVIDELTERLKKAKKTMRENCSTGSFDDSLFCSAASASKRGAKRLDALSIVSLFRQPRRSHSDLARTMTAPTGMLDRSASCDKIDDNASLCLEDIMQKLMNKIAVLESENSAYVLSKSAQTCDFSMSVSSNICLLETSDSCDQLECNESADFKDTMRQLLNKSAVLESEESTLAQSKSAHKSDLSMSTDLIDERD